MLIAGIDPQAATPLIVRLFVVRSIVNRLRCAPILVLSALGILLLAGCGGKGAAPEPGSANTLRYALISEPTTLDPAMVEDGATIDLLQNVFEGLVAWSEDNRIVPNLAERWDVTPDGKSYTFHLRKGVKFHNGREVTADDFKYSIERACDPNLNSPTAANYLKDIVGAMARIDRKPGISEVSGVRAVNKYTLRITIDAYKPYWLGNMTYPAAFVVCKEAIKKGAHIDERSAIGTGPFKLASYKRGYSVMLDANPDYYAGRPKLDHILRPILKDSTTRMENYETGKLDIVDVSPHDLDRIRKDPDLKAQLHAFPRAAVWYLGTNSTPAGSPFARPDVRRAFAYAIDKTEIVKLALKGEATPARGIVPPGIPDYRPRINPIAFDPIKARSLLAAAGYPDGKGFPTIPLCFRNDMAQVADTAQVIQNQLKRNLHVNIELRPTEWGQLLSQGENKSLPLVHIRWAADYLDPQDFLSIMLHTDHRVNGKSDHPQNQYGYSNPSFDRLCDAADVDRNPTRRMAEYAQAEQIAIDDAPWATLYYQKDLELVKPRVAAIRDSLFGHLPFTTTTVSNAP